MEKVIVKSITFANKQHRIEGMHIGPILKASDKVSLHIDMPFVACRFAQDPHSTHLVPMYGISDICIDGGIGRGEYQTWSCTKPDDDGIDE